MFALDLSENHIRVLELKKEGNKFLLHGLGEQEFHSKESLPQLIKELTLKTKPNPISSHDLALAVPEEETFIKVVRLPKVKHEDLRLELYKEIGKILPYSPEEVYWDWEIVKQDYKTITHYDVIFVASAKKIVDSYIELIQQAGFQPSLIETEANALLWGVINPFENHKKMPPTLILDFGITKTILVIFAKGAIRFTTSLKIAQTSQKNFLTKENLERIAREVKQYLTYYHEQLLHQHEKEDSIIKNMVLTGQWAAFDQLFSFFEKMLAISVHRPTKIIPIKPQYTTALGLALRGMFEEHHVDL